MRVLIVEDEGIIALHLQMLITRSGHEVCAIATDAVEAVTCAQIHAPDVALMDIRLARGTSGITAAAEIYRSCRVRCIFLSANLDEGTRAALQPYRPFAFIGKPILPDALIRALQSVDGCLGRT
jgi:DNA-binding NarL/FixJ family response regulator